MNDSVITLADFGPFKVPVSKGEYILGIKWIMPLAYNWVPISIKDLIEQQRMSYIFYN